MELKTFKNQERARNSGLVGTIILIVVALIILGYFGFNVRKIVESPLVHENLMYVWGGVKTICREIYELIVYLYRSFIDLIKELYHSFS